MKQLAYKNKSIGSTNSLAHTLGLSVSELIEITNSIQSFYFPNKPETKANGKLRQTYRVSEPLLGVQRKILQEIISNVNFPDFLQGSIKDPDFPRDYVRNANLHAGREVILKEDISGFFPSIRAELVLKVWKYFFNFPHDVAESLTKITTYNGITPEGAPTSPAIANLVFWEREPILEYELRQKGYIYSRYVDDITVSFATRIEKKELQNITTQIYSMFISSGLKPNRKKRDVQTKNKRMRVHKLNVNSGKPTLPKIERAKIRAAVKELELLSQSAISWEEIKGIYEQTNGRVNMMKRLHPHESQKYVEKIKAIKKQWLTHK